MNKHLKNDLTNLDALLEIVKAQGLDFLKNIGERPTSTGITYSNHPELNETGLGGQNTLQLFNERFENFSYLNFLPENSRRLKALPVWFSLVAYGKKGYQEIVENSVEMAQLFGQFIEDNKNFELLAPVRLNNVCFTLSGDENQEKVPAFLTLLNITGKVFMTPTVYNEKKGIRAFFVNWRTREADIEIIIAEIKKIEIPQ